MRKKAYYQRNRDVILNGTKECYKNDIKELSEQVKNKSYLKKKKI